MAAAKDLLEVFLLCPRIYANKRESCVPRQQSAVVPKQPPAHEMFLQTKKTTMIKALISLLMEEP